MAFVEKAIYIYYFILEFVEFLKPLHSTFFYDFTSPVAFVVV